MTPEALNEQRRFADIADVVSTALAVAFQNGEEPVRLGMALANLSACYFRDAGMTNEQAKQFLIRYVTDLPLEGFSDVDLPRNG